MNDEIKTELKTITPAWSEKILKNCNVRNRAVNMRHVAELAAEMKAGRWQVNGDTIRISIDNILIDGQHRLIAVVTSGITIQALVVTGLPSDVFGTIDCGKNRSPGDALGVRGEKNAYRLASVVVAVDKYMTGRADKYTDYSNTEIAELLDEKYPDIRESLQLSAKGKGIIPPSILDACHYIFKKKDPVLADEFVNKVIKGIGLDEGDPFHVLRERLLKNSVSKAKLEKSYIMALCIKAWNSARMGMKLRYLRWRDAGDFREEFPVAR